MYYTMYSVQYMPNVLYNVQYALYSMHYTVYNVQRTIYSVHCTLYSAYCTCTMYSIQCTMYSIYCILNITNCSYIMHETLVYNLCHTIELAYLLMYNVSVECTMSVYSVKCQSSIVYTVHCTVYTVHCTA